MLLRSQQFARLPPALLVATTSALWPGTFAGASGLPAWSPQIHLYCLTPLSLLLAFGLVRRYRRSRVGMLLWPGCGFLLPVSFEISAGYGWTLALPVTFAWLSALCYLAAACWQGSARDKPSELLTASCLLATGAAALTALAIATGAWPAAYSLEAGHHWALAAAASALLALAVSGNALLGQQESDSFRRWHGLGLLLLAGILAAILLPSPAAAEEAGWTACLAQLLGLACLLAAVSTPAAQAGQRYPEQFASGRLELLAGAVEHTAEGIMVTDGEIRILAVNRAFTEITGFAADEVLGKSPRMLHSPQQVPHFYRQLWQRLKERGSWQGELWNRRKNGDTYLERLTINAIPDADGRICRYVALFGDITETRRQQERIRELAYSDALTGLSNRALLDDRLEHGLAMARRQGKRLGLLLIDLDHFKAINDRLGHDAGDLLLQEVARRLSASVRISDTVARLGGDEFVVIMENLGETDACARLSRKIIEALAESIALPGHAVRVASSIGIAIHPEDGDDPPTLMKKADIAMYAAKSDGRGTYRFFRQVKGEDRPTAPRQLAPALSTAVGSPPWLLPGDGDASAPRRS